jgi:putative ABC transport system permease protein
MSNAPRTPRQARLLAPRPQAEVDDELAFHLERRIQDYIAQGMDPAMARAAALERFGDLDGVRSECTQLLEDDRRATARRDWFDDLRQDLRFGLRAAVRAPLFSLLAILTLALGIGANTAVFGVVKSVLLDALPYQDSDRLVRVYGRLLDGSNDRGPLSAGTVTDIAQRQRSFASVGAFASNVGEVVLAGTDLPSVVKVQWVEPRLLRTLGVAVVVGRAFHEDDAAPDTAAVVMLTHGAWQRLFAGDRGAIGRTVRINGIPRTVVGILPRRFVGPAGEAELYFPLSLRRYLAHPVRARGSGWLGLVGRMKPGVTWEAANRELVAIAADLAREYPKDNSYVTMTTVPLRDAMVGDTRAPLLVLMASAGLVLIIACANLAGALLSRTLSRRKEFAVRIALGAGRGRLVRQLLTEATLLAVVGGAVGIALAAGGLAVLRGLALPALPAYADLSLDPGALLFTSALALSTGLAFGLVPALSVRRANVQSTLRDETRGTSESRRSRQLRGVLVAGQIALSVSLLAGAGLLARSLWAMITAPPGFNPDDVLTVGVQLPPARYPDERARARFFEQFVERLRGLPGVTNVATTSALPTRVLGRNGVFIVGAPPPADGAVQFVLYASVSDEYFRTLGIPLKSGRVFGPQDGGNTAPTLVISEGMARRFWPNGGALGARVRLGPDPSSTPFTIVGIVGDVRNDPARPDAESITYASSRRDPWGSLGTVTVAIRTAADLVAMLKPIQSEVRAIDPEVALYNATTLQATMASSLSSRRLPVVLMMAFGGLALLLASVGVYAMFASMAAAREREFGVRVALGSSRGAIAALVLRQGAAWMAAGLAGGAVGVAFVARFIRDLLYGVRPFDPIAVGAAVVTLLFCATIALLLPVRRATRADPISVLR